jgi:hypothetical protein
MKLDWITFRKQCKLLVSFSRINFTQTGNPLCTNYPNKLNAVRALPAYFIHRESCGYCVNGRRVESCNFTGQQGHAGKRGSSTYTTQNGWIDCGIRRRCRCVLTRLGGSVYGQICVVRPSLPCQRGLVPGHLLVPALESQNTPTWEWEYVAFDSLS